MRSLMLMEGSHMVYSSRFYGFQSFVVELVGTRTNKHAILARFEESKLYVRPR